MPLDQTQMTPEQPVIESASATTSPDNANSGPLAYVVFGIVVGLLVLLLVGVSSCTSAAFSITSQQSWGYADSDFVGNDDYLHDLLGDPNDYDEDFDKIIREWNSDGYGRDPRFDS